MNKEPIQAAIDKFINYHRAVSSSRTVEFYSENINKFAKYLFDRKIEYCCDISQEHFIDYLIMLRNKGIRNVSVNTYTRAVRGWSTWLIKQGYNIMDFCKDVKKLRDDAAQIYPLTTFQAQLVDDITSLPFMFNFDLELRNYIVFHLMLDCGLRRQEVINLNKEDIQATCIVINNSKYNKSRIVPLPETLLNAINEYNPNTKGVLLFSKSGGRITKNCITKYFAELHKHDALLNVHPHMLRHTFATSYIAHGGNLEFLRIYLGHESYNITQRYLHVAAQCTIADIDIYKLDECFYRNFRR